MEEINSRFVQFVCENEIAGVDKLSFILSEILFRRQVKLIILLAL